jgi:hypothetical protein
VCGFSTIQQIKPTAISLSQGLEELHQPSGPKMRLNPAIGLTFVPVGLQLLGGEDQAGLGDRLPPTPPRMVASMTAPRKGATAHRAGHPDLGARSRIEPAEHGVRRRR